MLNRRSTATLVAGIALALSWASAPAARPRRANDAPPVFTVDPAWPIIPNGWVLGEVSSVAVDASDHVWLLHRPRTVPAEQRAKAAPPVLEFDTAGRLLASWGGPGDGFDWPEREHGIYVDRKNFVWISGNGGWPTPSAGGSSDDMILKFTTAGTFVLQIGHRGKSQGNADTANVHQPADMFVHPRTNEVFVADGYGNNRVIVYDGDNGRFKRMWGAFGRRPGAPAVSNTPGPNAPKPDANAAQFGLVHAIKVATDGTVYVADRLNNRIQLFGTDGTYLRQVQVTNDGGVTPVPAGFAFSPDAKQQYLYVVDSGPMRVVIFDRATMTQIGAIGMRGANPGEFNVVHHMAADSKGNLYTAEIVTNRRAQKFVRRGN